MAAPLTADRKLAAEVRRLTLRQCEKVLLDEENKQYEKEFRNALILKLAPTALPRITEVSGGDGKPLSINIVRYGDGEEDNQTT